MVEAGEASGALAEILGKVADYFESSAKLTKQVKSAMTYPITVIGLAVGLVNVLLIFVIPVFAEMFADFGAEVDQTQPVPDRSRQFSEILHSSHHRGSGSSLLGFQKNRRDAQGHSDEGQGAHCCADFW